MSTYVGTAQRITPQPLYDAQGRGNTEKRDNFSLLAPEDTCEKLRIIEVGWSGEEQHARPMATQLIRTTGGARPSDQDLYIQRRDDSEPLQDALFTRWLIQPDSIDNNSGSLLPVVHWNTSSIVKWHAGQQDEEIIVVGGGQVSCRNIIGREKSSYSCTWKE